MTWDYTKNAPEAATDEAFISDGEDCRDWFYFKGYADPLSELFSDYFEKYNSQSQVDMNRNYVHHPIFEESDSEQEEADIESEDSDGLCTPGKRLNKKRRDALAFVNEKPGKKTLSSYMRHVLLAMRGEMTIETASKIGNALQEAIAIATDSRPSSMKLQLKLFTAIRSYFELDAGLPFEDKSGCRMIYHCPNRCMAFTGKNEKLYSCLFCNASRSWADYFIYYSPRVPIRRMLHDKMLAALLRKLGDDDNENFWNGEYAKQLSEEYVEIVSDDETEKMDYKYFQDDENVLNIALMACHDDQEVVEDLLGDVFSACCLNLPLDIQTYVQNVFTLMAVKKPKKGISRVTRYVNGQLRQTDPMSFMQPFSQDMKECARGVTAYDASLDKDITVRIFCPMLSGEKFELPGAIPYHKNRPNGQSVSDDDVVMKTDDGYSDDKTTDETEKWTDLVSEIPGIKYPFSYVTRPLGISKGISAVLTILQYYARLDKSLSSYLNFFVELPVFSKEFGKVPFLDRTDFNLSDTDNAAALSAMKTLYYLVSNPVYSNGYMTHCPTQWKLLDISARIFFLFSIIESHEYSLAQLQVLQVKLNQCISELSETMRNMDDPEYVNVVNGLRVLKAVSLRIDKAIVNRKVRFYLLESQSKKVNKTFVKMGGCIDNNLQGPFGYQLFSQNMLNYKSVTALPDNHKYFKKNYFLRQAKTKKYYDGMIKQMAHAQMANDKTRGLKGFKIVKRHIREDGMTILTAVYGHGPQVIRFKADNSESLELGLVFWIIYDSDSELEWLLVRRIPSDAIGQSKASDGTLISYILKYATPNIKLSRSKETDWVLIDPWAVYDQPKLAKVQKGVPGMENYHEEYIINVERPLVAIG